MKRREFITKTGFAGVAVTGGAFTLSSCTFKSENKNWIWIGPKTNYTLDQWKSLFEGYKNNGIDAILLESFMGRKAFWESSFLESEGPMLETAIEAGLETGVEIHSWMWSMPCMIPDILENHKEWYNVNAKGESSATDPAYVGYYKFLCPSREEPRKFIQKRVKELSGIEGLAGVHLDYIRHPDAILPKSLWSKYDIIQDRVYPEYDYCYCDHCRSEFKESHGIDPLEIEDPTANEDWMKYRWNAVNTLVNEYLLPEIKNGGKHASAAVFPGPSLAKEMVRQDWGNWNLDSYHPMLYHSFYEAKPDWVKKYTAEGADTVGADKMYSGIYVPGIKSEGEFIDTIENALAGGASGITLFGMREEYFKVFKKITKA